MNIELKKREAFNFLEKLLTLDKDAQIVIMAKVDALHELKIIREGKELDSSEK